MRKLILILILIYSSLFTVTAVFADSQREQPPSFKHFPVISRTHVAFMYANDLWCAPRNGGPAVRLTDAPGWKTNVAFSPDGRTIGFSGNLDGNYEIYTVPIEGGRPTRITHLPSAENLNQWTSDGKLLFYTNSLSFSSLAMQLFTVPAAGGMPTRLPVPFGGEAAISPDGQWLAYTSDWPIGFIENWKHYRGGLAHDIWLFNLKTSRSKKITDWIGTDTRPMWREGVLYYLSDAGPENRLNIWKYDPRSGSRWQITRFAEYDVRNPSIGPGERNQGEVIFEYGPELYVVDLATGLSKVLEVAIPEGSRRPPPPTVDASRFIVSRGLSPDGGHVVLGARGDIWTIPVDKGTARNLTGTSGAFERDPVWSPDGKWVAYFSDVTGEYELFITPADGPASASQQLTRTGSGFKSTPVWSPDSTRLAFLDQTNSLYIHTVETRKTRRVDRDEWDSQPQLSWSPDSSWLVYTKMGENLHRTLWLFNTSSGSILRITSGTFDDHSPRFDPAGKYLFFLSIRNYTAPTISIGNRNFIYSNEETVIAVPLQKGTASPVNRQSAAAPDHRSRSPVAIDIDAFEARSVKLPIDGWAIEGLKITSDGNPIYVQLKIGIPRALKIFDLKSGKDRTIAEGVSGFELSADGRRALVSKAGGLSVADLTVDPVSLNAVSLNEMKVVIDRRAEWRQIFNDLWRLHRDLFYDPKMHRIDWELMRQRYSKMIEACATREDVNIVLAELTGELAVGHAYGFGGDGEQLPQVPIGMLGADLEIQNGAYRIKQIFEGSAADPNSRGPLSQPGVDVKIGDYLLAVNNKAVDIAIDPWSAFVGLAGEDTTLTVSDRPVIDRTARKVVVKPLRSESGLRYAAWVERNRLYIVKKTAGRVGYIHLPVFDAQGLNAFVAQYYSQIDKEALIIDMRWSQGGWLPDVLIKMLDPDVYNYGGGRYSKDRPVPARFHRGPKCILMSGMSISAGENFAYMFRKLGMGKLIGTRTLGAFVGLNGNPALIDGGYYNVPNAPFFETDGTWLIEGHGLDPDIVVNNDPAKLMSGIEPQLDAAIKQMISELKLKPFVKARKPAVSRDRRRGIVISPER